ncbi:MAG: hypothetical protein QI223_00515, partial [Candidatus Korarchaeota archaeon]|nr:hypothetical protein [Candidatus Korarchaeota archaeon]
AFAGWFRLPERDIAVRPEPAILVPAAAGALIALRRPRERTVQLGYLVSLAPVFATYEGRALIQGGIAFALVGVTALTLVLKRVPPRWGKKLAAALVLLYLLFPAEPSALVLSILANANPGGFAGGGFTWSDAQEIAAALIGAGVREGEVVHFDSGEKGCAVAVFAPIRIDTGMWGEVSPLDTGAALGENVRFLVTEVPAGVTEELGNLRIVGRAGKTAVVELVPEEAEGVNITELLLKISTSAKRASILLDENVSMAAEELGNLRLLLTSAYLALRRSGVEDVGWIVEAANGAGWLAVALEDPDIRGMITPEQMAEFKQNLAHLAEVAEAWVGA